MIEKTDVVIIGAGPVGLFAIFGIIRYRTDTIPPKEMTYLFVIIAVSVINALSKDYIGYFELTLVRLANPLFPEYIFKSTVTLKNCSIFIFSD